MSCCCGHDHHHEEASLCVCGQPIGEGVGHSRSMGRAGFAVAGGFLILNSFLLEWFFPNQEFASELSAVLGAIVLALPIIWAAIKDLCAGRVYMNELVAMALLAAFAGGVFREAGIIAFFLLITIIIETRTASGAQRSIEELIRLTPHTARKLVNDDFVETEVLDLQIGDIINVRPGENFPIDGQIVKGQSAVNQASITGESLPVDKTVGDDVYAGTMNLSGSIDINQRVQDWKDYGGARLYWLSVASPRQIRMGGLPFVDPASHPLLTPETKAPARRSSARRKTTRRQNTSAVRTQKAPKDAGSTSLRKPAAAKSGGTYFHAADAVLDLEAVLCERVLQKLTGLKFLTADFRQVKDTVRQLFQLRADLIDIFSDFFFHVNFPS